MLHLLRNQPAQRCLKTENLPYRPLRGSGKQLKWLLHTAGLPEKKTQQ